MNKKACYFFLLILTWICTSVHAETPLETLTKLKHAGLSVTPDSIQKPITYQPESLLIPASTIKILTALMALDRWGRDHHFTTRFYFEANGTLWIKGSGDPFITSEETDLIVEQLLKTDLENIKFIGVDEHIFSDQTEIDGQANSLNPYDAPLSALAINFNTVNIRKTRSGSILSAEKQTPFTPLHAELGKKLTVGEHRVNLRRSDRAAEFFAQVLLKKLHQRASHRISDQLINQIIIRGEVPVESTLFYTHYNSVVLQEQLRSMLKYSTNFIANQLFLMLAVDQTNQPASTQLAQKIAGEFIQQHFDWQDFHIEEGAGLSRKNRLSTRQMIDVLNAFQPYRDLMPEQSDQIVAKTGTLKGISTYAGYLIKNQQWFPFAIFINEPVDRRLRRRLAEELWQLQ